MKRILLLTLLLSLLAACSGTGAVPIGTGGDMDELRKSPCACGPVIPEHSQWVS